VSAFTATEFDVISVNCNNTVWSLGIPCSWNFLPLDVSDHSVTSEEGVWGMEVPQQGPRAEPRWVLEAKPPEAGDKC